MTAWIFGLPFFPEPATALGGVALPVGSMFALGLFTLQALRGRRVAQAVLRPFVAALFITFGLPSAFPFPDVTFRYVFFVAIIGVAVALYETNVPE